MLIKKRKIKKLSDDIRKIIDGQTLDLRDNREGVWAILKNDIHTLASLKNEQVDAIQDDRDKLKETLADISHQLKTPLTSMMIMADLLENALTADVLLLEKQTEFIANIKTGIMRMEWLVSALLKMAKIEGGAVEFSTEHIHSQTLVSLALEPLHILFDVRDQIVNMSCDTELYCDKRWTAEALTNVIKNASESSPAGGYIQIKSGINPICAWVSVTDSGSGINNIEKAKLFKRFEGSRREKGYGIGLPLALAIVRGQNGDIEVDGGGNGKGATFILKFFNRN